LNSIGSKVSKIGPIKLVKLLRDFLNSLYAVVA